jgi:hypothetical protein
MVQWRPAGSKGKNSTSQRCFQRWLGFIRAAGCQALLRNSAKSLAQRLAPVKFSFESAVK